MAFTAKELSQNEHFLSAILHSAHELMAIYDENPRIASIFAAQQRWLLAHAGYALFLGYPDDPTPALYTGRFVDFAVKHKIASRNTAAAFLKEMIAYRFVRPIAGGSDRRIILLEPTETTREYMARWIYTHLLVLDALDGGDRMARTTADPASVLRMQPKIAKMILDSESLQNPGVTFALFNWATSGGVVMDYLISRISKIDPGSDRVLIDPISPKVIQSQFMISSTHLKRLLKQATELGSVGWAGAPGKSSFWLSRNFVSEYWNYQAEKYAIVDTVSQAVLDQPDHSALSDEEPLSYALAKSA
ncbi:hypothetical protein N2601_26035 (plasmid) [Rhizobium sp. CB3060]|uniref:hypothetical protein n=1 Tax=unclassified Rhizobium TaxID=2613769 RepID=UPI0021A8AD96|nr:MULTISPECIES: hypothetical protein [Rhizobium]MDK4742365.1 hypothetical protein [Rhizobium sp. CNPSo 3464]UWU25346.1 hypothetical protein N2601_26035 [Rhizobium tropici]